MNRLQPLENGNLRQVTYTKKKNGILKQAKETTILCDNDIALLMFSPTGIPTLLHGQRRNLKEVFAKFANLSPQEREKRKLENIELLRKLHYDIDVHHFMSHRPTIESLTIRTRLLRSVLTEKHQTLSNWVNPENVRDVQQLRQMEGKLCESLRHIRRLKSYRKDHPNLWPNHTSQLHLQHTPLIPNDENQRWILPDPTSFLPPTDVGCSMSASARFGASTSKLADVGDRGQLDSIGKVAQMKAA